MNLSKLKKKAINKVVEIEGQKLEYSVKAKFLTLNFMQVISDLQEGKNFIGLSEALANAIESWKLQDELEDGTKVDYPPTAENIANLDVQLFITPLIENMFEVFTDAEKRQTASANT